MRRQPPPLSTGNTTRDGLVHLQRLRISGRSAIGIQRDIPGAWGKNGDESAFFVSDNYSYRQVHTNLDTGEWFVVRGNGLFTDVKATRVEGSIFEYVTVEAGQPFVVEDSAGNVVLRDRGPSASGSCSTLSATTSRKGRRSSF